MARVIIIERQLLHYRLALYRRMRDELARAGVELQLLIGEGTSDERKMRGQAEIDWAIKVPTRYGFGNRLCWMPVGAFARNADLVIMPHENKMIYNLWLLFMARPKMLAFRGHGKNMQSRSPRGAKERFKQWTTRKVDWWFTYAQGGADHVCRIGFPRSRVTVMENAIDTRELILSCSQFSEQDHRDFRARHGIGDGPVGLYLGSLYREKRLDFLIEAAQAIRAQMPAFELLVVGAGQDQHIIDEAAQRHDWVHALGALHGRDKAQVLALADVMLNPGAVGLNVLDAFAGECPMFTTECGMHGPEIAYIEHGRNGVITPDTVNDYAQAVVAALSDPLRLEALREAARASAKRYTMENMVKRFTAGILASLATRAAKPKRVKPGVRSEDVSL